MGTVGGKKNAQKFNFRQNSFHKRKIALADEIFVINVNGYIGESTKSEIEYAKVTGKGISYLEDMK